MAAPMQNQYRSKTMIHNWYEERCIRDATIYAYIEKKAVNDERAAQLQAQKDNLSAPVAVDSLQTYLRNNDVCVVVNHNTMPLALSCDPRYTSRDVENGRLVSLSYEVSPARRHTFQLRLVARSGTKYGNRDPNAASVRFSEKEEIKYGDRFYLLCNQDLIDIAVPQQKGVVFALGCPYCYARGGYVPVIAPLEMLTNSAEFTLEPYQKSERLQAGGKPVKYDDLVVLRHCLSGQCMSSGQEGPVKKLMDLGTPEFELQCKSCLNTHRHEDQCCAISLTVGGALSDQ